MLAGSQSKQMILWQQSVSVVNKLLLLSSSSFSSRFFEVLAAAANNKSVEKSYSSSSQRNARWFPRALNVFGYFARRKARLNFFDVLSCAEEASLHFRTKFSNQDLWALRLGPGIGCEYVRLTLGRDYQSQCTPSVTTMRWQATFDCPLSMSRCLAKEMACLSVEGRVRVSKRCSMGLLRLSMGIRLLTLALCWSSVVVSQAPMNRVSSVLPTNYPTASAITMTVSHSLLHCINE